MFRFFPRINFKMGLMRSSDPNGCKMELKVWKRWIKEYENVRKKLNTVKNFTFS